MDEFSHGWQIWGDDKMDGGQWGSSFSKRGGIAAGTRDQHIAPRVSWLSQEAQLSQGEHQEACTLWDEDDLGLHIKSIPDQQNNRLGAIDFRMVQLDKHQVRILQTLDSESHINQGLHMSTACTCQGR